MCGRFAITAADAVEIAEDLAREFGIVLSPSARGELAREHRPSFNRAPGTRHWVVGDEGNIHFGAWGFAQRDRKGRLFNARAETVDRKPTFRAGFRTGRALLICDGFYEWNTLGTREPWLFRPVGLSYFALAAIVDRRESGVRSDERMPDDNEAAFCLLTVPANETIAPMHPRMPALLGRQASREWLDATTAPERAAQLLRPAPVSAMQGLRVDKYVNDPAHDDPRCFSPPSQGSLF